MVLEIIFDTKDFIKNPIYPLVLGIIIPVIAFITSSLLFSGYWVRHLIGISTIMFIVILAVPTVNRLFRYEEKLELEDKKSFLKRHKTIIDFFIYFFIGMFIVFFILSFLFPEKVFSRENLYGDIYQNPELIRQSTLNIPPPSLQNGMFKSIFYNNFLLMLICFILSFFYGSGALFLITLNASIFASTFVKILQIKAPIALGVTPGFYFVGCNLSLLFTHMIPEIGAYLIAAIAGGILSAGIMREKLFSIEFNKIIKNSIILLLFAYFLLLVAAAIESSITAKLIFNDACIKHHQIFALAFVVVVALLAFLECKRLIFSKQKRT